MSSPWPLTTFSLSWLAVNWFCLIQLSRKKVAIWLVQRLACFPDQSWCVVKLGRTNLSSQINFDTLKDALTLIRYSWCHLQSRSVNVQQRPSVNNRELQRTVTRWRHRRLLTRKSFTVRYHATPKHSMRAYVKRGKNIATKTMTFVCIGIKKDNTLAACSLTRPTPHNCRQLSSLPEMVLALFSVSSRWWSTICTITE